MAQPVSHKDLLKLQRMEMALVRARLAHPDALSEPDYHCLRYLLGFARLNRFVPGAALRRKGGTESEVNQRIVAPLRELVLRSLSRALLREDDYRQRLEQSAAVLPPLVSAVREARAGLLAFTSDGDFSAEELDAEVGRKALVVTMGGGGGAGYVYIGAAARLRSEGISSDYLVGASIGALIAAVLARSRTQDVETVFNWAKSLRMRQIFGTPHVGLTHTLPGLMRLHLRAMHELLVHPDGSAMRLQDLEIPYEAIVAGVRARFYNFLPATILGLLEGGGKNKSFSRLVAERMVQLTTFINPMILREIVLGRDASTRRLRVGDAVGLSAAIPTILQYEPPQRDPESDQILALLREQEEVEVFVDGGVVDNVPARVAWEGVQAGRIGTRNAFYLALDCFQPQWDSRHLWLGPVQQLVQLQIPGNRPYMDWLMRFEPTLSPINLLPHADDFDQAWKWGWAQAEVMIPYLKKALEPVTWRP